MKFKLVSRPQYWWPVVVRMPSEDEAGKITQQTLKVLFEPQPRAEAIAEQETHSALMSEQERAAHEEQQLLQIVKNWDDVIGEDKGAIPFTPENLAQATQHRWFRDAVYRAYAESLNGQEAQLGN